MACFDVSGMAGILVIAAASKKNVEVANYVSAQPSNASKVCLQFTSTVAPVSRYKRQRSLERTSFLRITGRFLTLVNSDVILSSAISLKLAKEADKKSKITKETAKILFTITPPIFK